MSRNLGFTNDKNVIRQQRFAYDDVVAPFEPQSDAEPAYVCVKCGVIYKESDLQLGSKILKFCPEDRADLRQTTTSKTGVDYTEEEIKIIGAIRMASLDDLLIARQVADDVGCNVQKVAKFGEKLDREQIISRLLGPVGKKKRIYFDKLTEE